MKTEKSKEIKISDCEIIRKDGQYIIMHEGENIYQDWYSDNYDWLCCSYNAIRSMSKKYHTIEKLTLLRQALREDYVQGWSLQDEMIFGFIDEKGKLTKSQFDLFIKYARANDRLHHGSCTF